MLKQVFLFNLNFFNAFPGEIEQYRTELVKSYKERSQVVDKVVKEMYILLAEKGDELTFSVFLFIFLPLFHKICSH